MLGEAGADPEDLVGSKEMWAGVYLLAPLTRDGSGRLPLHKKIEFFA